MTILSEARAKAARKPDAKKGAPDASKRAHHKEKPVSDEEFLANLKPETRDWLSWLQRTFR